MPSASSSAPSSLIGVEAACDADVAARLRASKSFELIAPSKASPIDSETLRCATLPIEQADDPKCQALWAAQRRKFLAPKKQDDESGAAPDDVSLRPARARKAGSANPRPTKASKPMGGTGVIDRFLEVFTRYIDSGFGLLGGEASFLASTLVVIDVTLAALFWSWGPDEDIIARLVKKTLFVGVFAFLIGNWNNLARIVFESFSGLGLKAAGSSLSSADFLRPGRIAQVGIDAGRPILEAISSLLGYVSFFENFVQIVVLMFAWTVVLLSFFILAIQLFVTLIEFKLTTLAGFILIPFGLFGKTAFLAERVLGNVVSSGVKVLVLAVIVGVGSTLFAQFTQSAPWRSTDRRRRHGARPRGAVASGPRHLRPRRRQWHRLGRAAAWRGRRRRNRPHGWRRCSRRRRRGADGRRRCNGVGRKERDAGRRHAAAITRSRRARRRSFRRNVAAPRWSAGRRNSGRC